MSNHSRRNLHDQDVICTAIGCKDDADDRYIPSFLCQYHAEKVFRVVYANRAHVIQNMGGGIAPSERKVREALQKERLADQSVVYYIQFGQGIKIGTTRNMKQRLNAFCVPESAVLATEPGAYDLERSRHQFFRELRIGNSEVFADSPKVRKHIEAVKKYHGEPKITGYIAV